MEKDNIKSRKERQKERDKINRTKKRKKEKIESKNLLQKFAIYNAEKLEYNRKIKSLEDDKRILTRETNRLKRLRTKNNKEIKELQVQLFHYKEQIDTTTSVLDTYIQSFSSLTLKNLVMQTEVKRYKKLYHKATKENTNLVISFRCLEEKLFKRQEKFDKKRKWKGRSQPMLSVCLISFLNDLALVMKF